MDGLLRGASTLVMISHDLATVEKPSAPAIWLECGRVRAPGPAVEVVAAYRRSIG